jgi:hypothetical protein
LALLIGLALSVAVIWEAPRPNPDTPYHTVFEPAPGAGERVMRAPIARILRTVLAEVVARGGRLLSSHVVSRTAGFVFYVGNRWFGVITASVSAPQAQDYAFTSSLPLAVLKLLAPTLNPAIRREKEVACYSTSPKRSETPRAAHWNFMCPN